MNIKHVNLFYILGIISARAGANKDNLILGGEEEYHLTLPQGLTVEDMQDMVQVASPHFSATLEISTTQVMLVLQPCSTAVVTERDGDPVVVTEPPAPTPEPVVEPEPEVKLVVPEVEPPRVFLSIIEIAKLVHCHRTTISDYVVKLRPEYKSTEMGKRNRAIQTVDVVVLLEYIIANSKYSLTRSRARYALAPYQVEPSVSPEGQASDFYTRYTISQMTGICTGTLNKYANRLNPKHKTMTMSSKKQIVETLNIKALLGFLAKKATSRILRARAQRELREYICLNTVKVEPVVEPVVVAEPPVVAESVVVAEPVVVVEAGASTYMTYGQVARKTGFSSNTVAYYANRLTRKQQSTRILINGAKVQTVDYEALLYCMIRTCKRQPTMDKAQHALGNLLNSRVRDSLEAEAESVVETNVYNNTFYVRSSLTELEVLTGFNIRTLYRYTKFIPRSCMEFVQTPTRRLVRYHTRTFLEVLASKCTNVLAKARAKEVHAIINIGQIQLVERPATA